MRDITKSGTIDEQYITRLENRLAVLDRIEERLTRIEKLLSRWLIPVCPTVTAIDFQTCQLPLSNPYTVADAVITVNYEDITPLKPTTTTLKIEQRQYLALRCGYRTDIELPDPNKFDPIHLYYVEGGGNVEVTLTDGKIVTTQVPNAHQPLLISLGGYGVPVKLISLLSANEMFLLAFCARQ